MIIDFHTHIFPEKIASRAIAALEKSSGEKAVLNGTLAGLQQSMALNGIDCSVVLPIATKPAQADSIFSYADHIAKEKGIISFGSVHPQSKNIKEQLRACRQAGFKGIKLHPDYQDFFIDDEQAVSVMEQAAAEDLIVVLHAGMDISFMDCHHCTPRRLARILPRLKGAKIVAAHLGGWKYWDDVERYLMDSELYIDTSFTIGWCSDEKFVRIVNAFNPERVLFGSDSPWDGQGKGVRELQGLITNEKLLNQILYRNAAALLGIV